MSEIEAKLEELIKEFNRVYEQTEQELSACTTEGDEPTLRNVIEKVFALDKDGHENLQKIVSEVEKEQLNLNQAKVNMGQEKKIFDKPLVEKMQAMH